MDLRRYLTKKRVVFFVLFTAMALVAQRINFSSVIGAESQYFTLFQFFGPIAGSFLGAFFGIASILFAEVIDFFVAGKALTFINVMRLLPMLFAAYYFGSRGRHIKKISVFIPAVCIALFMIHPVGRAAWFYSLYWAIPIIVKTVPKLSGNVFLKGLGATFTAHAIGSTVFLYSVPMTSAQWVSLIPVTAYERLLFAVGIGITYVFVNTVLDRLDEDTRADVIEVDKKYVLSKNLLKLEV